MWKVGKGSPAFERNATAAADGAYRFATLPAGDYELRCAVKKFRTLVLTATVETGFSTTAAFQLEARASF